MRGPSSRTLSPRLRRLPGGRFRWSREGSVRRRPVRSPVAEEGRASGELGQFEPESGVAVGSAGTRSFGKLYLVAGGDIGSMAANAAKYGHCQVQNPVHYRSKVPFRPEVAAPLDFAVRAAEIYALDRELDRAVLRVQDYADLLLDGVESQLGPGELFLAELGASNATGSFGTPAGPRVPPGPRRRQFILNELQFLGERARFRPPWNLTLVQDAHALLLNGLGLSTRVGELRTSPYVAPGPNREPMFQTCPPERIATELQALLDWTDRVGPTLMPVIPATVLIQGFHSIRPFSVGSMTVGRVFAQLYLHLFGLPNSVLLAAGPASTNNPALLRRLLLWTETTGSYTELLDFSVDSVLRSYQGGVARWLQRQREPARLEETALRLLTRARRTTQWFSAQEAAGWIGGRSEQTVLRHLNDLVRQGMLESLGQTRAKRYRRVSTSSVLPELARRFATAPAASSAKSSRKSSRRNVDAGLAASEPADR